MVKKIYFLFSFSVVVNIGFCRVLLTENEKNDSSSTETRCQIPKTAPKNIENAITECQTEIQIAILSDAIELVDITKSESETLNQSSASKEGDKREKRSTDPFFTNEEKKIAGCLLQCVYRKMKAVNDFGFPKSDGLVTLYTEGVTDQEYIKGTHEAVNSCLGTAKKKFLSGLESLKDDGTKCDVAFFTFDCISDMIDSYCKQKP